MRNQKEIATALAAFDTFRTLKSIQNTDNGPESLVCGVLWWVLGEGGPFANLAAETVVQAQAALGGGRFEAVVMAAEVKTAAGPKRRGVTPKRKDKRNAKRK